MSDETTDTSGDDVVPETMDEDPKEKAAEADEPEPEEHEADADDDEPAPKPKAKEPTKLAPKRAYRHKVAGKEEEVPAEEVDALAKRLGVDPEMLLRGAGMFRAGQEKARTAAEEVKKATAKLEALKANPRAALAEVLGQENFLKLAIEAVAELAEEERLAKENPTELERRKLQTEREKLAAERKAEEDKRLAAETEQETARASQKLDGEIKAALESGKLPADPYVVRRLAAFMLDHLEKNPGDDLDDLSAEDFLLLVVDEMQTEHTAFIGKLSGEDIITRFPEMAEKVRAAYVARANGKPIRQGPPAKQPEARERPAEKPARKFTSTSQVLDAFKAGRL